MASDSLLVDGRRRPAVDSPLTPMPAADELSSFQQKEKEKCPRCESRDTKFCYYNNYNTSQPRHFCRSCRRYWTLGGSLRNVPIGGSSRNHTNNNHPNKRLRPNPNPLSSPNPNPNPPSNSPHVPTTTTCFLPFQLPPFRFDLGLSKAGPSASIADMGFGLGPTTLVWPSSLLLGETRTGSPTTGCFAVQAPGAGSGGPTDGERV